MFSTPSSASSKPAASRPGEFTAISSGTPEPRASQPAAPSAPRASEPDEFERLFGGSNAPAAPVVPKENPLAPPVGPGSVPSLGTGGFTRSSDPDLPEKRSTSRKSRRARPEKPCPKAARSRRRVNLRGVRTARRARFRNCRSTTTRGSADNRHAGSIRIRPVCGPLRTAAASASETRWETPKTLTNHNANTPS